MKKAIIDIGTNTFNLLIGEIRDGKLEIVHTEKEPVLLGMGGINQRKIANDAWDRALGALTRFKERCMQLGISDIRGIGTSALRDASNGTAFIAEVLEKTMIPVQIVSGNEEAMLIYKGVTWLHDFAVPAMIMDIGGGSTEFVLADSNGFIDFASFDIGVSRIYQELGSPDNYSKADFDTIELYLNARIDDFFDRNKCDILIGASGSFETFYEMIFQRRFALRNETDLIPVEELKEQIEWVMNSSIDERIDHPWIVPMRKRMIPIAAYKIKRVIEKIEAKSVILSPYSLKEGAFLD